MLIVGHHWLVLEKVLDVLERGELRPGFLDYTLLSQLLLLLLKDRLELLADGLWYHLRLLLCQKLLLLYLLLLGKLLLLQLLLHLLLFLFFHQTVEEAVHLVVGDQVVIGCNLLCLFDHSSSSSLFGVLLIYQVDVGVVPFMLLLKVLRQLRDLGRQVLVVLDPGILQGLLLLLAHQLIELVLLLLARLPHVLATVAQVPRLNLPLLLV